MSKKQEVVHVKGKSPTYGRTAELFMAQVFKLFEEGYVLHPKPTRREMPNLRGFPTCTLVTKEFAEKVNGESDAEAAKAQAEKEAAEAEALVVAEAAEAEALKAEQEAAELAALEAEEEAVQLAKNDKAAEDKAALEARTEDEKNIDRISVMTKKAEILEVAEELGIEVPEDIKQPNAIKKFLIETIG